MSAISAFDLRVLPLPLNHRHSVTRPPALRNDLGHLVNLSLRAAERPESLLRQLSRALVLAVTEEFDDAALVWCEAICIIWLEYALPLCSLMEYCGTRTQKLP